MEQTALVCCATPPPPSQRGEGVRGREEDSASSRAMTFISQNLSVLYPAPSIPFAAGCRTYHPAPVPPPLLSGEAGELELLPQLLGTQASRLRTVWNKLLRFALLIQSSFTPCPQARRPRPQCALLPPANKKSMI